ncbi:MULTISPECIES: ABC transporter permease [Piscirickettsiaceae]|jgi:putative ABC transport system permease protein|uniref:FtsX-like permease family protein n=1 Tax=Hydrogenovibrio thermophilus TaxID=265883 RepID=A0A410H208_9GAMM|nr:MULTISPECIES: ABC transporter permease [Piscirickettsiaceae]AZR82477.1 multidrug ABC transporter substrate-binding protein [Thiomicrospira sp. S5]QAB14968.1 FtsX-like permease family protein [Hydrogenovibrio thermophilus]
MIWNAFLLAVREIRRNMMRSALTMLGIIIGVAAVITMVTLGNGATAKVAQEISSLGSNLLMVRPGQRMGPGRDSSGAKPFKIEDVEAIRNEVVSVVAVAPTVSASVTAVRGNENWSTSVVGTNNDYFITGNWELAEGRLFSETELKAGKTSCVIGNTVSKELLGGEDALGKKLRLGSFSCDVIGVLEPKGQSMMGNDQDDVIIMPTKTVQRRLTGNQDVRMIRISVKPDIDTDVVNRAITLLLRDRRHLSDNEKNDFSVMDTREITNTLTGTTRVMTMLLGAVAAVSLVVGGIGIMNIMLVSVTERTREIGIRMAIGALEREVLLQFLVEAVVLSSLGGLIGIVLALIASALGSMLMGIPYMLDYGIISLAFVFSAMVGVVFGYFPARNAARLNPIDALRHE